MSRKDTVTSDDLQRSHLCDVHINTKDRDVSLFIGVNVPKAMEPWDVIYIANEGPFAVEKMDG